MMNLGLKRPPLAQIPYKTKKFQQAGKPKRAKAPPAPSIDEISDDNDRPQLIDLDSDTESSSSRDGCRNRNGSFNYNSNSTSTDSQTNDTFIEADFPNIPHDYPPPLPALRPDLYNLTFTHKSCAGFAAVFNAAKGAMDGEANGMPTITAGYIGNSESSKMGSFAPILDNEVSEFVGDSIIGMIVALLLRKWYPHLRPDGLTEIRSKLVNRTRLADWAKRYSFDKYLILPPQSSQLPIRLSSAVLCGTFEAYVASVYDQAGDEGAGMMAVKQWIEPLCRPYADFYSALITNREKEVRETPRMGSMSFLQQMMDKNNVVAEWTESGGLNPRTKKQEYWIESLTLTLDKLASEKMSVAIRSNFPLTTTGKAPKKKGAKEIAAYKALQELSLDYCEFDID